MMLMMTKMMVINLVNMEMIDEDVVDDANDNYNDKNEDEDDDDDDDVLV